MNIYRQEIKMSFKSFFSWSIGTVAFIAMFMSMFPSFYKSSAILYDVLSAFPEAFKRSLGLSTLNLTEILGYYGFLFTYILMIGSIFALKSGLSALSLEIISKSADFLLAKPVSRIKIINAKVAALLTMIIIQNTILCITSYIALESFKKGSYSITTLLLINLSLLLVQLHFAALGLFLSAILSRIKTVLPLSLGVVFSFFIIQMINQSLADPKLSYITPFAYFDVPNIIKNGSYECRYFIVNTALILIYTALAYFIYNKKDIPSV